MLTIMNKITIGWKISPKHRHSRTPYAKVKKLKIFVNIVTPYAQVKEFLRQFDDVFCSIWWDTQDINKDPSCQ